MKRLFTRLPRRLPAPYDDRFGDDRSPDTAAPKQPTTVAADTSGSMLGSPIEQVNRAASQFAQECCRDVVTRQRLDVQLVTFGGDVQVYPFVPIARFAPPPLVPSGGTPFAEAILKAIEETERYRQRLEAAEAEVLKPYYFLFSDGYPTSSPNLLDKAAMLVHETERRHRGAFYAFGVNQAAAEALQPCFPRPVHILGEGNFAEFFHIVSVSVIQVSSTCVHEDADLTPTIRRVLRLPYSGNDHA